jgi:DNA helicase-2/ATP-dependent DNA helicase PcrA
MHATPILENLNPQQHEVVTSQPSNVLVLAGAGSGKTRVLAHRIAWLINVQQVPPTSILAVTFTNKAAREMRGRIEDLVGMAAKNMWVGTFHGLCHRLLRLHWRDANLPENFQVLDSEDQYRLIRRVLKNLNLDEEQWSPKKAQWFINAKKDEGLRPDKIDPYGDIYLKTMVKIYAAYEQQCQSAGAVDFAELLLRVHDLWQQQPHLRSHYQQRFMHIMVDEFQDTNAIQYNWIKMLSNQQNYFMIVGDDDQSIYGWRGARVENVSRFIKDFANTLTVRLEQNYRSTGTILEAANALITHNDNRMGKNLWTEHAMGDPIMLYAAFNEFDEARYITDCIKTWINQGNRRDECAVLYRSNAQSRVLEEAFIQAGIPYRVYGGLRFFERAEIKDALAYLRLILNRQDDTAFERIVNTPTRGIGNTALTVIRELARDQQLSLWQACQHAITDSLLPARAAKAISHFIALIEQLAQDIESFELGQQMEHLIHASGLFLLYSQEKGEKGQARIENLNELVTAARFFKNEDLAMTPTQAFLSHAALETGDTQAAAFEDCVQLMTLHSAKGLEFPLVILTGIAEGIFPHQMSMNDKKELEEERRLCYVGITRAQRNLHLTYAEVRRLHGKENYHRPSRFISEIPSHLIKEIRLRSSVTRPVSRSPIPHTLQPDLPFTLGRRVVHKKFGEGIVLAYEGSGNDVRVHVKFQDVGSKWLMASYIEKA